MAICVVEVQTVIGKEKPTVGTLFSLLKKIHNDKAGGVSIETVLIIAAIALPILIFVIKFGWPRIRRLFEDQMKDLEGGAEKART